jgi:hypothetical protein
MESVQEVVMPYGVVRWFDETTNQGLVARRATQYPVLGSDMDPRTRRPGARVHFDVRRQDDVQWACDVRPRVGGRSSPRQHRFGDLAGAHHPDEKGHVPSSGSHPQEPFHLEGHPTEVARTWLRLLVDADFGTIVHLYAPEVVLNNRGKVMTGRRGVEDLLRSLPRPFDDVSFRGTDGAVTIRWKPAGGFGETMLTIRHGKITGQVVI